MTQIEREFTGDALLADIEAADPGNGLVLWWLGQSAFLLKSSAGRVLFDPRQSSLLSHAYGDADQAHFRPKPRIIEPGSLTSIDVVTSSRPSADKLDTEVLAAVFNANPRAVWIVPETSRKQAAERLGCNPAWPWGLNGGESVSIGEITVLAVPATEDEIRHDELGRCRSLSYVVWFGNVKVYHGGTIRRSREMIDQLRPLAVDVAILPFDEKRPMQRVAGDPTCKAAAQFAHDIEARLVVPYNGEASDPSTAPPDQFETSCRQLGQAYKTLQYGERLAIEPK